LSLPAETENRNMPETSPGFLSLIVDVLCRKPKIQVRLDFTAVKKGW